MRLNLAKSISVIALLTVAAVFMSSCILKSPEVDSPIIIGTPDYTPFSQQSTDSPTSAATPTITPEAIPTLAPETSATPIPQSALDGHDESTPKPKLTYEQYRQMNPDVIGWIKIPNTKVDYPIVKCPDGDKNEYYLTHGVDKDNSKSGAIFMDYRVSTSSKHVIIYGHNMRKGTMFAGINNYSTRSFYDANRTFSITFGDTVYTYKVFAVYDTHVNNAKYMTVSFGSSDEVAQYMNMLAGLSIFPTDVTITASDHCVTLSTCNHTNYSDGRFVVHAVRIG